MKTMNIEDVLSGLGNKKKRSKEQRDLEALLIEAISKKKTYEGMEEGVGEMASQFSNNPGPTGMSDKGRQYMQGKADSATPYADLYNEHGSANYADEVADYEKTLAGVKPPLTTIGQIETDGDAKWAAEEARTEKRTGINNLLKMFMPEFDPEEEEKRAREMVKRMRPEDKSLEKTMKFFKAMFGGSE